VDGFGRSGNQIYASTAGNTGKSRKHGKAAQAAVPV